MGNWGYENFERDDACDELGILLQQIVEVIRGGFNLDATKSLYEGEGDSRIIANIDIVCTLCEHYETVPEIKINDVLKWQTDYLNVYDNVLAPNAVSQDYVKNRRLVVAKTFDRLYQIVKDAEEE